MPPHILTLPHYRCKCHFDPNKSSFKLLSLISTTSTSRSSYADDASLIVKDGGDAAEGGDEAVDFVGGVVGGE